MELSIICPVYNEIGFIDELVRSLTAAAPVWKEILLVDGGSTDGTRERIKTLAATTPGLMLIENPEKYVSPGFNKAFHQSTGHHIAFIGAHAEYPIDYFEVALKYLNRNECDAVGGPLRQMGKNRLGKAIAYAMSTKFGVGDTEFRTANQKMYVQSVAFAVYKRTVFEKAGLLDEQLIRNQDDEFHYRLNAMGFRMLMVPEMQSTYYVRSTLRGLFSQYFQYGLYKPLVLKKVRSGIRIRHLIPAVFVIYLVTLPVAFCCSWWLLPLAAYSGLAAYFSSRSQDGLKSFCLSLMVFPVLHIAYGLGFLIGLFKRNVPLVRN